MPTTSRPEQGDDDGAAGEDHRASGGRDGRRRGLVGRHPLRELVSVARQDEQAVVDADGETDHEGEQRRRAADHDELRCGEHAAHGDADPDEWR